MSQIELRTFTEDEYHLFFQHYVSDSMVDPSPFVYNEEQVSRSFLYNHGGFRDHYEHFGIFIGQYPVGSFQLKRIDHETGNCEFGIILQNNRFKNLGIGTEAIRQGMSIAKKKYGMKTITGDTMSRNTRMIRVFQKLHFELIETAQNAFDLPDGTKVDRLVFRKDLGRYEDE